MFGTGHPATGAAVICQFDTRCVPSRRPGVPFCRAPTDDAPDRRHEIIGPSTVIRGNCVLQQRGQGVFRVGRFRLHLVQIPVDAD